MQTSTAVRVMQRPARAVWYQMVCRCNLALHMGLKTRPSRSCYMHRHGVVQMEFPVLLWVIAVCHASAQEYSARCMGACS